MAAASSFSKAVNTSSDLTFESATSQSSNPKEIVARLHREKLARREACRPRVKSAFSNEKRRELSIKVHHRESLKVDS